MKKGLLILLSVFFTIENTTAQLGNIANGGFESWTIQTLYESPTDWTDSNSEGYNGLAVTTKSTTAQMGTYSVKLETAVWNNDTLFGYVYHGATDQNGPSAGIPYVASFNSVRLQVQSDIVAGDTLYMMLFRYTNGVVVDVAMAPVAYGTNSAWTQVDITVTTIPQDELFIGFVLGNPNSPQAPSPGSWALIDNIEMLNGGIATTALPNPSFETWATTTTEDLDNWNTLNPLLAGVQLENAVKTIDANTGTYAVEMTTILAGVDTIPSFLSLGVIDFNANGSPFLPMPYIGTPNTFSGAYKYTPINNDQASIQINFMLNGTVIGQVFETFNTLQTAYTTFSTPITITGTPDSIVFLASSGSNPGSVLKLDDLQFSGGNVGISENISNEVFNMYPNPANDVVTIDLETENSFSFYIYNLIGKLVASKENTNEATKLNVSNYPKGTYLIKVVSGDKMFTEKLIIE